MNVENILVYLDQKIVLLEQFGEVTSEMEQQLDNLEELDYTAALATRQRLMERIDKCDELINRQIAELPEAEQDRWRDVCSQRGEAARNEQEQEISQRVSRYRQRLREISFSNSKVESRLNAYHAEVKEQLNQKRYAAAQGDGSIIHE